MVAERANMDAGKAVEAWLLFLLSFALMSDHVPMVEHQASASKGDAKSKTIPLLLTNAKSNER